MILRYLLSSLVSRPVLPTQAEYFLPAFVEPTDKRERTTNDRTVLRPTVIWPIGTLAHYNLALSFLALCNLALL